MQALLIIDMQRFVTQRIESGIAFYPTDSMTNMQSVIATFRRAGKPVLHVRHETLEPGSPLHRDTPQFLPVEGFEARDDEPVFVKTTSSAFNSTDLHAELKLAQIDEVTVIGAVAGFCINSTIRSGSDLGLAMTVVRDAVVSFPLEGADLGAKVVLDVTLGLLEAGFARGVNTAALID